MKGLYLCQKLPGITPEIFALRIISTEKYSETGCTFTPDGKEFYFTLNKGGLAEPLIFASRFENSSWTDPEQVMFHGYELHISLDGKRMFITKCRRINNNESTLDLWILERNDEDWNESQNLGPAPGHTQAGMAIFTLSTAHQKRTGVLSQCGDLWMAVIQNQKLLVVGSIPLFMRRIHVLQRMRATSSSTLIDQEERDGEIYTFVFVMKKDYERSNQSRG